jgi:signal transduction histidine kinase
VTGRYPIATRPSGYDYLGHDMRGTLRVLIAEDNEDDYDLVTRELRGAGFQLVSTRVDNAAAMSTELETRTWDLVLSDWHMPGFGAAAAVEVLVGKGVDIPFIIVSGTIGEDTAVEAMKCGAHDFLVKDKLARLVPAIERELKDAHVRRERRKMQEQLLISDRMASVGMLAAGVAHEINNPLAAVLANLDLAHQDVIDLTTDTSETPRVKELLDELGEARDAAVRIRDIVRDLKLFSRSEDEKRNAVDIERVLDSSLRMAWNEIRHRATLVKDYQPVPPVEANESRLGQVFLNLVVNAAQAIPEGRASSNTIRVATYLGPGGRVVVEVGDTGSGMPRDVLKRLFTPFFTTKPVGVGTGLGLSICHRIVTALGGDITVESVVGRGSTFRVTLPPAPLRREATTPMIAIPAPQRRARILVIDDEPSVLKAAGRILSGEHDVTTTNRAQDALAMFLAGERFEVILCDLMMPEMTGMELHAEMERLAPDQADKVVFLTGGAFTARARAFLDQVKNLRFEKPFDATMLRSIVQERLR